MATPRNKKKKASLVKKANKKAVLHMHRKMPGQFDQFKRPEFEYRKKTQNKTADAGSNPIATKNAKALVPAAGLYSPAWTSNIAPNKGPLFEKLSLELRLMVWENAIDDIGESGPGEIGTIEPLKCGNKFRDEKGVINLPVEYQGMARIGKKLNALYMICQQAYFEIHGSGLFYRRKHFKFSSASRMMNYLSVIHPISRNAIKTMELEFWIRTDTTPRLATSLTFPTINSMENLQNLHLRCYIQHLPYVSDGLIKWLENNKGLKNLKGIRNFSFELGIPKWAGFAGKAAVAKILKAYEDSNALKWSAKL